jgi:hypothetical protein
MKRVAGVFMILIGIVLILPNMFGIMKLAGELMGNLYDDPAYSIWQLIGAALLRLGLVLLNVYLFTYGLKFAKGEPKKADENKEDIND